MRNETIFTALSVIETATIVAQLVSEQVMLWQTGNITDEQLDKKLEEVQNEYGMVTASFRQKAQQRLQQLQGE